MVLLGISHGLWATSIRNNKNRVILNKNIKALFLYYKDNPSAIESPAKEVAFELKAIFKWLYGDRWRENLIIKTGFKETSTYRWFRKSNPDTMSPPVRLVSILFTKNISRQKMKKDEALQIVENLQKYIHD